MKYVDHSEQLLEMVGPRANPLNLLMQYLDSFALFCCRSLFLSVHLSLRR